MKMSVLSQKNIIIFFILFLFFFLLFCHEKTDEELIMGLMKKIGTCAEKKDIASIIMNITDDYSDFKSRGKSETEAMLKQYFERYRGIVVYVLSTRIERIEPPEAYIQTEVALSSGAARVFRKLIRFSTDNYRLKIKLIKRDGKWLIQYAEWKYVSLNELFPKSLSILKKIFGKF